MIKHVTHCLLLVIMLFAQNTLASDNKQKIHFVTEDKQKIVAWLELPTDILNKPPVIILIHQGGSSKDEWTDLALWQILLDNGYAVLAYDIRQHGESSTDKDDIWDLFNNPKRAPLDLQAAIQFIQSHHKLNANKIGIIGASVGANLAVMASALPEYPIQSVVAISGKVEAAQNLANADAPLKGNNLFAIASEKEQEGLRKQWAQEFYQQAIEEKKVKIAKGNAHGSSILIENPELNTDIIQWLNKTL